MLFVVIRKVVAENLFFQYGGSLLMVSKEIIVDGVVSLATFHNRPNRFLVNLVPNGQKKLEKAFLHDPGRMKELLTPKAKLVVRKPINLSERKTQ